MKVRAKKYLLFKSPLLEKTTWQQIDKYLESSDEINVSYFSPNTWHSAFDPQDILTKALQHRQRVSSLLSCSLFCRDTGCRAAFWSPPGEAHQETALLLQPGLAQSMRVRLYPKMNKILSAHRSKTWRDHIIGWIMPMRPGIMTVPQVGSIVLGVLERTWSRAEQSRAVRDLWVFASNAHHVEHPPKHRA